MPEGPEIRREADRIGRVLAGRRVASIRFAFDHLQPWQDELRGSLVRAVESRGKALLVRFDCGLNVYSHNQLYGRWYVKPRGQKPRTNRQLRLAIETNTHAALLYSASEIEVLRDEELPEHEFLAKLGPDVLDTRVRVPEVVERLRDERFRRRSLGALLLDQSFVSGLGNYLRSEILFVARIDPGQRPRDLTDDQTEELAHAILEIARRAYRLRGITNDPDDARRLRAEGVPRRDYRHYVFGRARKPCRLCGEPIAQHTSAGRRLYQCRACLSLQNASQ